MKNYYNTLNLNNDYFSDKYDTFRESAKNAYLFSMMSKYWQAHILPTEEQKNQFMKYYQPHIDVNYKNVDNNYVKNILQRYAQGSDGFYYRIVPRRSDWISGDSVLKIIDDIYNVRLTDDDDPYCLKASCISGKNLSNNMNNTVNEHTWNKCDN